MIDSTRIDNIESREKLYKDINEVYCPYLKEKVIFNALGLEHLIYKRRGKLRNQDDRYMRFKMLPLAPIILSLSHTVQGIFETKKFEYTKMSSRWEYILREVCYYEFMAVINRDRCKVVVKRIENGDLFFWSIIPFFRTDKHLAE